jgi:Spy/CpxP family protein refolding chaperone
MNRKALMVVLVLSLAMNASILGTMGYHYYRDSSLAKDTPCPLSPTHQHLYQELGLSTQQLSKMEPLAIKFHERLAKLQAAVKGKNTQLMNLLTKQEVDPARVEGLRKETAGIQDEIQKEVIAHILESKSILNPKQQQRFFDLVRQSMPGGENQGAPR